MRIGKRGQVTIPARVRERYGLTPGTAVEFVELADGVMVTRHTGAPDRFAELRGCLRGRRLIRDIDQYLKDSRGR